MVGLWIFLLFVGIITLPCNSTPDDIDDFSRMSATLSMQNSDSKIQNDRYSRDFELKSPPATVPSYLAHFLQQGNNLFFKPQILLGSSLNNPYNSHESDIKENKEKHENQINLSVNSEPIVDDKVVKESDKVPKDDEKIPKDDEKIPKDDENIPKDDEKIPKEDENVPKDDEKLSKETEIERVEEKSNEKFSEIPEAPILAPLEMPALPQVIVDGSEEIIVDEPENVIIEEIPDSEEVSIEKEHNIVVPEAPQLMPLNPHKIPVQIFIPKPQVPTCIPTFNTNVYETAIPCFPNYVQPQNSGLTMQDYENILQNKERIRTFPLPRVPLGVTFNRPVKSVLPFRGDVISTTRYLPSVTVSKFPLIKRNRKLLKYPHRRLSQMLLEKIPLRQEKVETFDEPMSSFSAYCAHNIALQRVVPNIVENGDTVKAVPFLELPERPVY